MEYQIKNNSNKYNIDKKELLKLLKLIKKHLKINENNIKKAFLTKKVDHLFLLIIQKNIEYNDKLANSITELSIKIDKKFNIQKIMQEPEMKNLLKVMASPSSEGLIQHLISDTRIIAEFNNLIKKGK